MNRCDSVQASDGVLCASVTMCRQGVKEQCEGSVQEEKQCVGVLCG